MEKWKNFYNGLSKEVIDSYWKFLHYQPKESDLIDPYWQMAGMVLAIHNEYWPEVNNG